jgi:hypothetical protein
MAHRLVVHCKRAPYDTYVGRPTKWGNPFVIGKDGTRTEVIGKYRDWLGRHPALVAQARQELVGKILGCWCAPQACHADVLAEIANEPERAIEGCGLDGKHGLGMTCYAHGIGCHLRGVGGEE